ncbi:hypothetical protein ACJX0J_012519, partial [Zea mays]
ILSPAFAIKLGKHAQDTFIEELIERGYGIGDEFAAVMLAQDVFNDFGRVEREL